MQENICKDLSLALLAVKSETGEKIRKLSRSLFSPVHSPSINLRTAFWCYSQPD